MPSKKWLEKEVTINRDEFSTVIAEQVGRFVNAAELIDRDYARNLKETLFMFSACVGTELFGDDIDDLEVE